jgi:hypothetical protein
VEVAARGRLDAVQAGAHFHRVQINLHDPPLAPHRLDEDGEPGFGALANIGAAWPQEDVLGGLLADRRAAAHLAGPFLVVDDGLVDGGEVEAMMGAEPGVLAGDHGAHHGGGNAVERNPTVIEAVALDFALDHQQRDRRRCDLVDQDGQGRPDDGEKQQEQDRPARHAPETSRSGSGTGIGHRLRLAPVGGPVLGMRRRPLGRQGRRFKMKGQGG